MAVIDSPFFSDINDKKKTFSFAIGVRFQSLHSDFVSIQGIQFKSFCSTTTYFVPEEFSASPTVATVTFATTGLQIGTNPFQNTGAIRRRIFIPKYWCHLQYGTTSSPKRHQYFGTKSRSASSGVDGQMAPVFQNGDSMIQETKRETHKVTR